jgi:hypothetical protein
MESEKGVRYKMIYQEEDENTLEEIKKEERPSTAGLCRKKLSEEELDDIFLDEEMI